MTADERTRIAELINNPGLAIITMPGSKVGDARTLHALKTCNIPGLAICKAYWRKIGGISAFVHYAPVTPGDLPSVADLHDALRLRVLQMLADGSLKLEPPR